MTAPPCPPHARIMGVNVSAITMADALRTIEDWIGRREQHFVCITGVHGVIESQSDPELMAIHERAGLVTPDGMPLVWMARKLGYRQTERVYGPDLMLALSALSAQKGYRQYYYGGAPGLAERLRERLAERFPGLP
ncbi:MAG: glycosyltransferase, partial [Hyphomicrobiales bacterium]